MVLTLESVNTEMKATDQYFTRILFIMQQKVVVNFASVEEILDGSFRVVILLLQVSKHEI